MGPLPALVWATLWPMGELSVIQVVIVLVVTLLVFGPARLPELGRQLGKGLRELKQQASGLGADLERAVDDGPPVATPSTVAPSASTADGDAALLDGVVVTHDGGQTPAPAVTTPPPLDEDDLLRGVVVSGDTPAADLAAEANPYS